MYLRSFTINDAPIILSWTKDNDPLKTVIRFGFVIVDDQLRGKGYGKQMLQLAIQKAKNEFGAKKINLGVFDNNPSALHCYESVGFKIIGTDSYIFHPSSLPL